jgi:Glucodextranase, domain B/PASTA domain
MLRPRIAAIVVALLAPAVVPALARAAVTQSRITSWVSSQPGTPANNPYLISFDNPPQGPTTLSVSGTATPGAGNVDIVCYFGSPGNVQDSVLQSGVPVTGSGTFSTPNPQPRLRLIGGHACRLRAVPAGGEATGDNPAFAGPQVAVSEAALPVAAITGGPNAGAPYNIYINDVTLTGYAAWSSPGGNEGCGGPFAAPIDPDLDLGNFAIDCVGALLSDDLRAFGGPGRSEVQVDGRNAYDPASAQALFPASGSNPASQDLPGFPTDLTANLIWDPTSGLLTSRSDESWVVCNGPNEETPSFGTCPGFLASGVKLQRDITTGDGGRVVSMTDTWSSIDGKAHALDLLYDDFIGLLGRTPGERGYEFPGQTSFSQFGQGKTLPGAAGAPGSILVRTNVSAPDGDPSEAAGAITFGTAASGFAFASNNEFEEHQIVHVPAGASASLTYIYSVGYSPADVSRLALAAQDQLQGPALTISSPASGTIVSSPTVTLSGTATSGSGISSLSVGGHPVSVGPGGAWSTQMTLSPGTSTITAQAIDGAGESAQTQVVVSYTPPSPAPPAPPPPAVKCDVPTLKGMKLATAERAVRRAHCKVGKIKRVKSRKVRKGRVTSSSPPAGRRLRAGSKVELFVSKGR